MTHPAPPARLGLVSRPIAPRAQAAKDEVTRLQEFLDASVDPGAAAVAAAVDTPDAQLGGGEPMLEGGEPMRSEESLLAECAQLEAAMKEHDAQLCEVRRCTEIAHRKAELIRHSTRNHWEQARRAPRGRARARVCPPPASPVLRLCFACASPARLLACSACSACSLIHFWRFCACPSPRLPALSRRTRRWAFAQRVFADG